MYWGSKGVFVLKMNIAMLMKAIICGRIVSNKLLIALMQNITSCNSSSFLWQKFFKNTKQKILKFENSWKKKLQAPSLNGHFLQLHPVLPNLAFFISSHCLIQLARVKGCMHRAAASSSTAETIWMHWACTGTGSYWY